jgi:hypothetical protein
MAMSGPEITGTSSAAPAPALGDRFAQVLLAPAAAMRAVAERPAWFVPIAAIGLLMTLYTAVNVHVLVPEQAEMQMDHAPAAQLEALQQQIAMFSDPPAWLRVVAGLGSGVSVALFAVLAPGLVLHLFLRLSEGGAAARQTVGVVAWAGLIPYGLRTLLSWLIVAATGSGRQAGLTAASLLPEPDPQSLGYMLANLYGDPFVYWMLWVIVLGVVQVHRLPAGRVLTVVAATYILLSAVPLGFTLLGQTLGGR